MKLINKRIWIVFLAVSLLVAQIGVKPTTAAGKAYKIVALGDSLTWGDGDELLQGGYPARLETLINAEFPGSKVTNLGHTGWDTTALIKGDQGLGSELSQAVGMKPDIALVWIGSNDLWYLGYAENATEEGDKQVMDTFSGNINTILRALHENGAKIYIALLDDQTKRPVATTMGYSNAQLVRMSKFAGLFNTSISDLAKVYGARTVDFSRSVLFTTPDTLDDDGNHPNAAGYDAIARIWYDTIHTDLK